MGIQERRKREKDFKCVLAINAAMAIYNEEGYHAITIEKIAGRSELSRASLYLYFRNKDEILTKAIVSHTESFIHILQDLDDNKEGLKETLLQELWSRFIKFYETEPETFNVYSYFLQSEMILNLPKNVRDIISVSGSKVVKLQHKIVEYGIKEGLFTEMIEELINLAGRFGLFTGYMVGDLLAVLILKSNQKHTRLVSLSYLRSHE